ncbi:MAG: trypsin-like peptidase domain-containing protein [Pyrinomonadaceae bacterium]
MEMEANATAKGMLSVIAGGELAAIAQITQRATAQVRVRQGGGGSGIVWRENGLVVTNAHVVRGRRAEVKLANGETFHASVAKRDDARDLALLKLESFEPLRLTTAVVGDSDRLRAGEIVFAVGHPFGKPTAR